MTEQDFEMGNCYKIEAYWPDARSAPEVRYTAHLADALDRAIQLAYSGKHTTIRVITPDALEVIKMWGQLDGLP
jgi:hypothetical protein